MPTDAQFTTQKRKKHEKSRQEFQTLKILGENPENNAKKNKLIKQLQGDTKDT